jgi:transcriptional repressor NF-X1
MGPEAKRLECSEECERIQRNKRLAEALEINESHEPAASKTIYEDELLDIAEEHLDWIKGIESVIAQFMQDKSQMHHYFPTKFRNRQNQILVLLAPYYGLVGEWVDAHTSKGNVIYRKQSKKEPSVPLRLLSQAIQDRPYEIQEKSSEEPMSAIKEGQEIPINALLFKDLTLGLEPENICAVLSTFVGSDLELCPESKDGPSADCVVHFQSKSGSYVPPNAIDQVIREKVLDYAVHRWVDQEKLVSGIEPCRLTAKKDLIFPSHSDERSSLQSLKTPQAPAREQILKVENAFNLLPRSAAS